MSNTFASSKNKSPVAPTSDPPRRGARNSPKGATNSQRAPEAVDRVLLEAQVVKVEWPGQKPKPLAVWLDLEERCLHLQQVSLAPNTRKLEFGGGTSVNFDQISEISEHSGTLEIHGPGSVVLVRLMFDTDEELQIWFRGFRCALDLESDDEASGEHGDLVSTLKALVKEQEGRFSKLRQLTMYKDEHLLKLHDQLEESLGILQNGQKMYAEQQKVVDAQQRTIDRLKEAFKDNDCRQPIVAKESMVAPHAAAAFTVAAQAVAPKNARARARETPVVASTSAVKSEATDVDDFDLIEQDSKMEALLRRTEDLQRAAARASDSTSPDKTQPEILAHLNALIKEKDELEAQLREEQASLEVELQKLHATKERAVAPGMN